METRECNKGFLLSMDSENGGYIPFFIQVRDKDIIWDDARLPQDLVNIVYQGENVEFHNILHCWRFTYNDWFITLYSDSRYEAISSFNIREYSGDIVEPVNKLIYKIDLPFTSKIGLDTGFNISLCIEASSSIITTSNVGIVPNTYSVNGTKSTTSTDNISIYIANSIIPFSNDIKTNKEFINDKVNIKITGFIK